MKKFNTTKKINKKKIFIVIFTMFSCISPVKLFIDFLMKNDVSVLENIIQSFVFGIVLSLVSIYNWRSSGKKLNDLSKKSLIKEKKLKLKHKLED